MKLLSAWLSLTSPYASAFGLGVRAFGPRSFTQNFIG